MPTHFLTTKELKNISKSLDLILRQTHVHETTTYSLLDDGWEKNGLMDPLHQVFQFLGQKYAEPCQIVLLVDKKMEEENVDQIYSEGKVRIHAISLEDSMVLKELVKLFSGKYFYVPNASEGVLEDIIRTIFPSYHGFLAWGRFSTPIHLEKDPCLLSWSYGNFTIPSVLSIVGFIESEYVDGLPSLGKHTIVEKESGNKLGLYQVISDISLMHELTGIVYLSNNYFGLINSVYAGSEYEIILTILEPNRKHKWLMENLGDFVRKSIARDFICTKTEAEQSFYPKQGQLEEHKQMFIPLDEENLDQEFARLKRYVHDLPRKRNLLGKLCIHLQKMSRTYHCPQFVRNLVMVLEDNNYPEGSEEFKFLDSLRERLLSDEDMHDLLLLKRATEPACVPPAKKRRKKKMITTAMCDEEA